MTKSGTRRRLTARWWRRAGGLRLGPDTERQQWLGPTIPHARQQRQGKTRGPRFVRRQLQQRPAAIGQGDVDLHVIVGYGHTR
jgi:hypothetical protein